MARMLLPWLLAACSSLPSSQWPPHVERTCTAVYLGPWREPIELPTSSPQLTLLELHVEPAGCTESFANGKRRLVPPPGCLRVQVRCRYRAYVQDGRAPSSAELFPGALPQGLQP